jgi:AbrB family looped-hinge helix DNA binding protein
MSTTTLSSKGQLVIPRKIRQALHLKPGDKIKFTLEGQRIVIEPERTSRARLTREAHRKVLIAPPDAPPMTPDKVKALLAEFP